MAITEFDIKILEMLKPIDITEYLDYLTVYIRNGETKTNDDRGKQRKLSSVRSMYNYFFLMDLWHRNQ